LCGGLVLEDQAGPFELIPVGEAPSRGERLLGIDIGEIPGTTYDEAVTIAKGAGCQFVSLSLAWDVLETGPGTYDDTFPDIANGYYPARDLSVALVVSPIDTNVDRRPADLRGLPMNASATIARYTALLDHLFGRLAAVDLVCLSIGNEVDIFLGDNETAWGEYTDFFEAAAAHARSLRPGLIVGAKATLHGLLGATAPWGEALNTHTDAVLTTYYPLDEGFQTQPASVVLPAFQALATKYGGKALYFLEIGCPSGARANSSQATQQAFIHAAFQAWDQVETLRAMNFVWMFDRPASEIDFFLSYYGVSDPAFRDYLATLGLIGGDGVEKHAFRQLVAEADARGWGSA
jgi:hypothetical protein